MTWRVVITRDQAVVDGTGDHQRTTVVRVLAFPVTAFDTQAEAEAKAQRVRNANQDPTLDVAVEAPAAQVGLARRPDDRSRAAAAAGIAAARAALRKDAQ